MTRSLEHGPLAISADSRAWHHVGVFVRWFFLLGGIAFLLAALVVRERPGEGSAAIALTFTLMGVFWAGPQLLILASQRWRAR